ncbi:MAG: aldehyde oxygenase (deformylating) [Cyanobacteria bacterium M5B4]|nr:aldehyde oxygenase (deformylating) [Cyanobacteria bacterium KgW148]PLS69745.1 MAG: aldehyde oxygenase (deformylating) [Cyanobacteria bacterium M5B4]
MTNINYECPTYKDSYSRINAIVIEGEQEAHDNYISLMQLLPDQSSDLSKLAKMEEKHKKGFTACGNNLKVIPDMAFAREFFHGLHQNFQDALQEGKLVTCLLIQSIIIECFAIAAYNIYIPVADPFARKITENVVKDEYLHLNFGAIWLKENFSQAKAELEEANRQNLPLVWQMLNQVAGDAKILGMEKEDLMADFLTQYSETLAEIGFSGREIMKMAATGIA